MRYMQEGAGASAYCGAPGTGKTHRLVQECKALVDAGTPAADIYMFAASTSAAAALQARLEAAGVAGVSVTTPMTWALDVLKTDAARAFTHREAHVLNDYECDFFFEDMRVTGEKQHRLREMLKFFYRGWSEMRDDEPGWLISEVEVNIEALAKDHLAMMRAYHPCEVAAACVRYLAAKPSALEGVRRSYVLADDFRSMSRASQRMCELLAGKDLIVTWDDVASLEGEETYGYVDGLDELAGQCNLARTELSEYEGSSAAYEALSNLYKQDCVTAELPSQARAGEGTPEVCTTDMLEKEPANVVRIVQEALDADVAPEDIFVVAGRASWAGRIQGALEDMGIRASRVNGRITLKGDIRDPERCADMAMANAVHLVADPTNCLAWRCWCGFGDYLCRSAAFSSLLHVSKGLSGTGNYLNDLLDALVGGNDLELHGEMLGREGIEHRVCDAKAMLADAQGLTGADLIAAIRAHVCADGQATPGFDALVGDVASGEGASELIARIDEALAPAAPKAGSVRVGEPDDLIGQAPRVLVLCGLTNGLYPEKGYFDLLERTIDDQAKMHDKLIHQLIEVCAKAGKRLVLSGFTHADILDAEPMKLMSERIRLRNGHRVCEFAPSAVIDYVTGAKTAYVR